MKKIYCLVVIVAFLVQILDAQEMSSGFQWGVKGGGTVATQRWGQWNTQPLFRYHGVVFIESAGSSKSALYTSLGYHARGSAFRNLFYTDPFTGQLRRGGSRPFIFHNVALVAGAKSKREQSEGLSYYYALGMRGEVTVKTNLDRIDLNNPQQSFLSAYVPIDNNVRRFNFGFDIAGGVEKKFTEFTTGFLELTISPDFSRQYIQFPIAGVTDPFTRQPITVPGQSIRNFTIELSLGVRFMRKVIYE
jgi:hypothetical protein